MQISGPSDPKPPLSVERSTLPAASLKPGSVVEARVLAPPAQGTAQLEIGGRVITADNAAGELKAGQILRLQVESSPERLLLRIVEPTRMDTQLAALRGILPRQQPLDQALQSLQGSLTAQRNALPEGLAGRLETLLARGALDLQRPITPELIRSRIADSGLFLENRLARQDTHALSGDFKASLLRVIGEIAHRGGATSGIPSSGDRSGGEVAVKIANWLQSVFKPLQTTRPAPRHDAASADRLLLDLLKPLEGALARVQLHQLTATLRSERAEEPAITLEIPVTTGAHQPFEAISLTIRREAARRRAGAADAWSVVLDLPSGSRGRLRAVVALIEGSVTVTFQAEDPNLTERFLTRLDLLRERLIEQGLTVGKMAAHQGVPDEPGPDEALASGLLHEEA